MTDDVRADDVRADDVRVDDVRADDGASVAEKPASRTAMFTAAAVGLLMLGLLVVLATRPDGVREARSPRMGKIAPELSGVSLLGADTTFDLTQMRGRYVVVNFFATWCPPCIEEHPELVAFEAAHAASGNAAVVSVVFNDNNNDVRKFFAERGGSWPVLDNARAAVDFGVLKVPESFVVDPDGVVIGKFNGGVTRARIERLMTEDIARRG